MCFVKEYQDNFYNRICCLKYNKNVDSNIIIGSSYNDNDNDNDDNDDINDDNYIKLDDIINNDIYTKLNDY